MNKFYEDWLKREEYQWKNIGLEIKKVEKGFELNDNNSLYFKSLWNESLYLQLLENFNDCEYYYTYLMTFGVITHFVDFKLNGMFFRIFVNEKDETMEGNIVIGKDSDAYEKIKFDNLDNKILINLHKKFQNFFECVCQLPKYRIKIVIKEIEVLSIETTNGELERVMRRKNLI